MLLSKKSVYALRALIHMAAYPPETTFQIRDLAERNGIPKKFLELILLELRNAGILASRRGVGGGYLLARRPETVRAGDVIRVIEGPLPAPTKPGAPGREGTKGEPSDAVDRLVRETAEAIGSVLNRWTLSDLQREEREARERRRRESMYFI